MAASTAALILAGGRGERLGGAIKSELVIGGQRLLERVAARLEECSPLLVAHGFAAPADLHLVPPMIPLADLDSDYAGPLAGLAAAVDYLAGLPNPPDLLVSAAVDTPFLPPDYLARLRDGLGSAPAALASYGGQPYPTNSIWRLDGLLQLPRQVLAGTAPHSLKRLAASLGALLVQWPENAGGDPFANINTPDELDLMRRRAGDD